MTMCRSGESRTAPTAGGCRLRWTCLYGVTVGQLVALAAVEMSAPPHPLRVVLRWSLALGTFVGMGLWVNSNRAAFDLEHWCACAPDTITVRIVESRRPVEIPPTYEPPPSSIEEPAEPALR